MDRVSLGLGAAVLALIGSGVGAYLVGMSPDQDGTGGGSDDPASCEPVSAERAQTTAPQFVERYMDDREQPVMLAAGVSEVEDGVGLLVTVPDDSPLMDTVRCFRGVPVRYMTTSGSFSSE